MTNNDLSKLLTTGAYTPKDAELEHVLTKGISGTDLGEITKAGEEIREEEMRGSNFYL